MITRGVVAVLVVCLGASTAVAGKPKAGPAKALALAWIQATYKLDDKKPDYTALAAMTGDGFFAVVVHEQPDGECDVTADDRSKLSEAFECVKKSNALGNPLKPWSKKDKKKLWGSLREFGDEIDALAKTNQVFIRYEQGEGITVLSVIAVGVGADKKPLVTGMYGEESYN